MAGPNGELDWHFKYWNEEMGDYAYDQLKTMDTILTGRATYEGMADYWPYAAAELGARRKDIEFAEWMNGLSKVVFSKTLDKVKWNNSRLIKENIAEEINKMKQQPGKDMIMWGGVGIVKTFLQLGLIDDYRIWISPVVLGSGIPFGKDLNKTIDLNLVSITSFSTGVVLLNYSPHKNCR
jgi:dihydrofolate reductase